MSLFPRLRAPLSSIALSALALSVLALPFAAGCGGGGDFDTTIDTVYDACAPLTVRLQGEVTDAEQRSLQGALSMWNAAAGLHLSLQDPALDPAVEAGAGTAGAAAAAPAIPVRFESAGPMTFGFYDDQVGDIIINRLLNDDRARTVVIAHELGHAFGLPHVDAAERVSLMNPGNRSVEVQPSDVAALQAVWGACDASGAADD